MCQKVEFAGWARFKPKVTPYSLRDVDTPDHRRLRATSRDKAELAEPGSVPGYIESFTASNHRDGARTSPSRIRPYEAINTGGKSAPEDAGGLR
jgi:hypothetical protein